MKQKVKLKVLKCQSFHFEEAMKTALRFDPVIWSSKYFRISSISSSKKDDAPEIGKIQRTISQFVGAQRRQTSLSLIRNACTKFHTTFCRPWKCSNKKKVNIVEAVNNEDDIETVALYDDVDFRSED